MFYQRDIIELIGELESIDMAMENKEVIEKENKSILSLMMKLLVSDLVIGFSLSLSILLLSEKKIFTIPMLYHPNNAVVYYLIFALHYLQIIGIGSVSHGKKIFFFFDVLEKIWKIQKILMVKLIDQLIAQHHAIVII